jgi:hypothetical protein
MNSCKPSNDSPDLGSSLRGGFGLGSNQALAMRWVDLTIDSIVDDDSPTKASDEMVCRTSGSRGRLRCWARRRDIQMDVS